VDAYEAEHKHFRDAIFGDREPMPNVEQGLAVQAVLDAVQASAKKGQSVPVSL